MSKEKSVKVAVVGAGTAGISIAARILRQAPYVKGDLLFIDPAEVHYYQPAFSLVGAGDMKLDDTYRSMERAIPEGTELLKEHVATFQPEENTLKTKEGTTVKYEYLVVAAGLQYDWDKIEGLTEALKAEGKNGVCSNYSPKTVEYTWTALQNVNDGRAIFTQPSTPIKCAGAPQKIMYLTEEYLRKMGVRHKTAVEFISGMPKLFPVPRYYGPLKEIVKERGIETTFSSELRKIDGDKQIATFENIETGETFEREFSMIHVVPQMSAPDFIKESPLAKDGWVDVDMYTLRHNKYPNVFGAGDNSSLPTSRTGAAVRKQAPVAATNLVALMEGREMTAKYDGYSSCPLVTGYDKVMLAEFVYGNEASESTPLDQRVPRRSMFFMKKNLLPILYWNGMLRGTM